MRNQKKWNAYIMLLNHKFYLRKSMSTTEAVNWLLNHCKIIGTDYFKWGTQVFCERR